MAMPQPDASLAAPEEVEDLCFRWGVYEFIKKARGASQAREFNPGMAMQDTRVSLDTEVTEMYRDWEDY
jgi:hypothetical protein